MDRVLDDNTLGFNTKDGNHNKNHESEEEDKRRMDNNINVKGIKMELHIQIPREDYISYKYKRDNIYRTCLGDFYEPTDYKIVINLLANYYCDQYKRQTIRLTPIERIGGIFLIVKEEHVLTDLMIFMAIYHENKLKWESGGKDLD